MYGNLKMGFGCHPKKLDCWMTIEIFWSLMTEFEEGACNIFLGSSHHLYV
jgi:hypothetical protein